MSLFSRTWLTVQRAIGWTASSSQKRYRLWQADRNGPNSLVSLEGEVLRDRARDLARNNPVAASAIDALRTNLVGTGIVPMPKHRDPQIREYLKAKWLEWTDHADFDQAYDWYGLSAMMVESMVRDGESIARYRIAPENAGIGVVPLQVEVLEPDHLPFDTIAARYSDVPEGNRVISGVEFDDRGKRVAYHLLENHPNETAILGFRGLRNRLKTVRIAASDVVHLRRTRRPKQIRAETWLYSVAGTLFELEKYDNAERLRKVLASSLTGFFTTSGESPFSRDEESSTETTDRVALEPNTFLPLLPNQDVKFAKVEDTGPMYEVYMRCQLRKVARALYLAYHQLSGDNSQANFSSVRTDLIEVRRAIEQIQYGIIVFQLCTPTWNRWLDEGVRSRTLNLPDYKANSAEYRAVEWQVPGWQWVDPLKEAAAAVEQINNGLNSRQRVCAERGINVEDLDREIQEDQERAARHNLAFGAAVNPRNDELVTQAKAEMAREMVIQ